MRWELLEEARSDSERLMSRARNGWSLGELTGDLQILLLRLEFIVKKKPFEFSVLPKLCVFTERFKNILYLR